MPFIWYFYIDKSNMPNIDVFLNGAPSVGQIYDTDGKVVIQLAKEYRKIVPFEKIPPHIRSAILAAEDTRFFNYWLNHGIDYIAIARAIIVNGAHTILTSITEKRSFDFVAAEGASTITQQTVRLYFLQGITKKENNNQLIFNNFANRMLAKLFEVKEVNKISRKIIEIKYAIWLEAEMTKIYGSRAEAKKQIFIRFTPYLGNGRYGFETASEYYFGKHIWELTPNETEKAALLAGMIKNPALYTPKPNQTKERSRIQLVRRNKILARMAEDNYLNKKTSDGMMKKPVEITVRNEPKTIAPSVVNDILKEVRANGFEGEDIFHGDIQIKSTVNLEIQKIVNEALEKGLEAYEKRHPDQKGLVQGSVVVLKNSDAAILAMAGGRQFYQGQRYKYSDLNRVKRVRQAGSAFKPFVYLTAFMNGWKPSDIISDYPISVSMGYGRRRHYIQNYDGNYIGPAPLEVMLYRSRNAPTVSLTLMLGDGKKSGMEKIAETVKLLGINSELHHDTDHRGKVVYYVTSALGASEVNVLELANAYRAMASGLSAEPYMIREITDRDGNILFERKDAMKPLSINKNALRMLQSSLRKVVTHPGGTAYSLTVQKFPVPVMGKTGTTNDFRNALFAGSTYGSSGITVVTRIDFDDNSQLAPRETGALAALPVFKEIVQKIYKSDLAGPMPQFPEDIEQSISISVP